MNSRRRFEDFGQCVTLPSRRDGRRRVEGSTTPPRRRPPSTPASCDGSNPSIPGQARGPARPPAPPPGPRGPGRPGRPTYFQLLVRYKSVGPGGTGLHVGIGGGLVGWTEDGFHGYGLHLLGLEGACFEEPDGTAQHPVRRQPGRALARAPDRPAGVGALSGLKHPGNHGRSFDRRHRYRATAPRSAVAPAE